jgi:hypothetical protein
MSHETTTQPAEPAASPPVPSLGQCENCGTPLYGKYCYACGQPTNGLVRHFGSVLSDIADSVLNIDERVFKTLLPLYLRPGKLTLDYFAGKRARYVTPFRLVFFLAIVAFFSTQITVRAGFTPVNKAVAVSTPGGKTTLAVVPGPKGLAAPISSDDGAFANGNLSLNDKVLWNRATRPLRIGWLPDPAVEWINDLIGNAQQQLHAMNAGTWDEQQNARRKFTLGMYSAAPTVLFVLLPIFALMLKVFYIFKRRLYMEHLIVAMHSHAFLMLSMLVLVLIGVLSHWLAPHGGWPRVPFVLLSIAAWIWIFVYLWLMQKRVYRQGWFMTNVKYWSLGFCYTILLGIGFAFVLLLALTSG